MTATVVLAGGAEMQQGCEAMDRAMLARCRRAKPRIALLPTATARHNPALTGRFGTAYFERLGAACEVLMVTSRENAADPELAARVTAADLVYLPGGDPDVLLEVLRGSLVWQAITEHAAQGGVIGGSSAGAMAICERTLLGGLAHNRQPRTVQGLNLLQNLLVVPHYTAGRAAGTDALARALRQDEGEDFTVLGIAEQTAVLGNGDQWQVVGPGTVTVFSAGASAQYRHGEALNLQVRLP